MAAGDADDERHAECNEWKCRCPFEARWLASVCHRPRDRDRRRLLALRRHAPRVGLSARAWRVFRRGWGRRRALGRAGGSADASYRRTFERRLAPFERNHRCRAGCEIRCPFDGAGTHGRRGEELRGSLVRAQIEYRTHPANRRRRGRAAGQERDPQMTTLSVCLKAVDSGLFEWELASLGILFTRWLLANFVESPPTATRGN